MRSLKVYTIYRMGFLAIAFLICETTPMWAQTSGSAAGGAQGGGSDTQGGAGSNPGRAVDGTLRNNGSGMSPQIAAGASQPAQSRVPGANDPSRALVPGTEAYDRARSVPGTGDPRDTQRQPLTENGSPAGAVENREIERGESPATNQANGQRGKFGEQAGTTRGAIGITLDNSNGMLMVGGVAPDSPAFQAGLRQGDVIVSIDRRIVRTPQDVTRYMSGQEPGREVMLQIERDGRASQVAARVGAWNEVFADSPARHSAYSPPTPLPASAAAEIAQLRTELQVLREELRQLRETLKTATPTGGTSASATDHPANERPGNESPTSGQPPLPGAP